VRKTEPPAVKHADWSAHPVDRFLLAKMEERGLAPSADADPRAVIRRLTFALTGLPPTPGEVEAFVQAAARDRESAIREATERLLASPHFGERWARHWMDLVRYAETHGSEGDPEIPEAWRYRDYLIRAFNADVPLDQLIREHLAGDLLPQPRWNRGEQFNESILGIAHLRFVEHGFQPVDTRDEQVKTTDSQIDVAMKAFQALTVSCARCHDHKFDAISQRDYYALAGIFESSRPAMVAIDAPDVLAKNKAALAALKPRIRAALAEDWKGEPAKVAARLLSEVQPDPRAAAIAGKIGQLERQIASLEGAARERLAAKIGGGRLAAAAHPVARWTFETGPADVNGTLHGELHGAAAIRRGRLILDGKDSFFRSAPIGREIREKTLEAWVALATLDQRGGGIITIENASGAVFDSVVFAEKEERRWVAGSNNFRRSRNLGGPPETAKADELVHVAVAYRSDGTIAFYRNGRLHGEAWKSPSESPISFAAGDAHILLGRRHTGGGRAFLAGEVEEARLYDRALTAEELLASFRAGPDATAVDSAELAKVFTDDERRRHAALSHQLADARAAHRALMPGATDKEWRSALAEAAESRGNPLHAWARLRQTDGEAMEKQWIALAVDARVAVASAGTPIASVPPRPGQPAPELQQRRWNFTAKAGDFTKCFHYGTGIDTPGTCGDFAVLAEGDTALNGLLPAGVATNRLSNKHHGVLTTRTFRVETDSISVKAWGGGGAQTRLIVDGYPLGTNPIFPRAQLSKDEPGWLRIDTKYRKGSLAYLEFATAMDQTRREKSANERSWFGVSEIVCHDADGPRDAGSALLPILAQASPHSVKELAQRYEAALGKALESWRAGTLDESQRPLLDFFIRRKLLPANLAQLPTARPLVEEYRRIESEVPAARFSPGVLESAASDAAYLPRGDHLKPGELVPRAYLGVFDAPAFQTHQSGRLELARALTDSRNPLTARVMANRIWHHVFGRGIVATPDNFGRMGEKPTHPELLDYLASKLIEEHWSLKAMLRFLVTTRAFSLGSEPAAAARERDAGNELLSHANVHRLDAESLRDSLLVVSGTLDGEMFGPGTRDDFKGKQSRRSIYLPVRRTALNPFLGVFDAPKPFTTTGGRDSTNVPAQSLALLNDPFVVECARHWADRLVAENADADAESRIRRMFVTALTRPPQPFELSASRGYVTNGTGAPVLRDAGPWADLAQSLFNLKEFIYLR
jgi:hypothetical protein